MTARMDDPRPGPRATTLVELLRFRARCQPDQRAYTFLTDRGHEGGSLTYSQLDGRARAIAASIRPRASLGERVLLLYPSGLEYVAAFFGCLYAGVVAVPAFPPQRSRSLSRLKSIAADVQASMALSTTATLTHLDFALREVPALALLHWMPTDHVDDDQADEWSDPRVAADALALLQYTSGSTSAPRGVMVSHRNLLHNERMIQAASEHTEASVVVGWLPLYHDMGLIGNVLQPLYVGIPCVLMSPAAFLLNPFVWLDTISRYRATTSAAPNFGYELCVRKIAAEQRAALDLSTWTLAYNGSEPIRPDTIDRFAATFAPCGFRREAFYPCYGLAEATLFVTGGAKAAAPVVRAVRSTVLLPPRVEVAQTEPDELRSIVGCGAPGPEQLVVIVDPETRTRCANGVVGEIWISGPSVASGYWNRPDETRETFHAALPDAPGARFLRTGDLGLIIAGELFVTGRLKDLVIIRGRNLYPQDIELTAERSNPALRPGGGGAFSADVDGEEQLIVAHEVDSKSTETRRNREIMADLREAVVTEHQVPVHSILLLKPGALPRTSSGKVQRSACRAGYLSRTLNLVDSSMGEVIDGHG